MNCELFCTEPATKVVAAYRATYSGHSMTRASISLACDEHVDEVVETLGDIAGETGFVETRNLA